MNNSKKTEKLVKLEKLGSGTYGEVWKVRDDSKGGKIVAIKLLKDDANQEEGVNPVTLREISILKQCKHPNIVQLFEISPSKKGLQLIFEFIET